jgi:hypothetical protein
MYLYYEWLVVLLVFGCIANSVNLLYLSICMKMAPIPPSTVLVPVDASRIKIYNLVDPGVDFIKVGHMA